MGPLWLSFLNWDHFSKSKISPPTTTELETSYSRIIVPQRPTEDFSEDFFDDSPSEEEIIHADCEEFISPLPLDGQEHPVPVPNQISVFNAANKAITVELPESSCFEDENLNY